MGEKRHNMFYMTCIKIFAMLMVAYGHFITTSTYAVEIPGVIPGTLNEPLLPATTQILWKLESAPYLRFHIEFAVIGVVIFFLVSGYFIPSMQKKYNCKYIESGSGIPALLFSRMFRLYPTIILCVLLNGILVYCVQGIRYRAVDYIGTALLLLRLWPVQATMGVVWYLMVLLFAYFIATVVPKITAVNLTVIYMVLGFCVLLPYMLGDTPVTWMAQNLGYLARYAGIVFLGSYVALSKSLFSKFQRVLGFGWYFYLTILLQKVDENLSQVVTTYSGLNTYLAAFLIIAVIYLLCRIFENLIGEKAVKLLRNVEKVSFAFYLVHVHFGLTIIYILKQTGVNAYINLACAFCVSAVVAYVVTEAISCLEDTKWYKKVTIGWIT